MPGNLLAHQGRSPVVAPSAYLHASAQVIGQVEIGEDASVWCNTTLRGDVNFIRIGRGTNVQDGSVLHVSHRSESDPEGAPLIVGDRVTIGHLVILHGCTIQDECLIGMGSVVMDKVIIEPRVLLGAGSLVPEGKRLLSGNLYVGRPAKLVRPLGADELAYFDYSARHYVELARSYRVPD